MVAGGFALGVGLQETGLAQTLINAIPFGSWPSVIMVVGSGLIQIFWRFRFLFLKLLQFEHAAGFDDGHVLLEMGSLHVGFEGFGAFPGFANHEDFAAGSTFENVVSDAAFIVELCFGGEGDGGFEGIVVLTLVGLEETIESDHIAFVLE